VCRSPAGSAESPIRQWCGRGLILGGAHQADFESPQVRIKYNTHLAMGNVLRINIIAASSDVLSITRFDSYAAHSGG
jgi:hypothetical protein